VAKNAGNDKMSKDVRQSLKECAAKGGKYFKGTAQLFLASGSEYVAKELPTIAGMVDTNEELLQDVARFLRNPVDNINRQINKAMQTEDFKALKRFAGNALDDLKTGNLYDANRSRSEFGEAAEGGLMDNFGDVDMSAFDENGDWNPEAEDDEAWEKEIALAEAQEGTEDNRTEATIEAVAEGTAAIVHTENANAQADIRLSLKQHSQIMNAAQNMVTQQAATVQAINQTAVSILDVTRETHNQMMGKMQEVMNVLTNIEKNTKPVEAPKQTMREELEIFGNHGEVDIRNLFKMAGKNLDEKYNIGSYLSMITGAGSLSNILEYVGDNPWQLVTDQLLTKIMPETFKRQLHLTGEKLAGFFPALLTKWADAGKKFDSGESTKISDLIKGIFGASTRSRKYIDTGMRDPTAQALYTSKAAKAIEEVIPTLLSQIHSDLTGLPLKIFDYKEGKFTDAEKVLAQQTNQANDLVNRMGSAANQFVENTRAIEFVDPEDQKRFNDVVYQYLQNQAENSAFIDPHISREEFRKTLPGGLSRNDSVLFGDIIQQALLTLDDLDLEKLSSEIIDARMARNQNNAYQNNMLHDTGKIAAYMGMLDPGIESQIISLSKSVAGGASSNEIQEMHDKDIERRTVLGVPLPMNTMVNDIRTMLERGIITYTYLLGDSTKTKVVKPKGKNGERIVTNGLPDNVNANIEAAKKLSDKGWKRYSYQEDRKVQEINRKRAAHDKEVSDNEQRAKDNEAFGGHIVIVRSEGADVLRIGNTMKQFRANTAPTDKKTGAPIINNGRIQEYEKDQIPSGAKRTMDEKAAELSKEVNGMLDKVGFKKLAELTREYGKVPFDLVTDGLKVVDSFLFRVLYGEDASAVLLDKHKLPSILDSLQATLKANWLSAKSWFAENIGNPFKKFMFDPKSGLLPQIADRLNQKVVKPVSEKLTGYKESLIGKRDKNRKVTEAGDTIIKDKDGVWRYQSGTPVHEDAVKNAHYEDYEGGKWSDKINSIIHRGRELTSNAKETLKGGSSSKRKSDEESEAENKAKLSWWDKLLWGNEEGKKYRGRKKELYDTEGHIYDENNEQDIYGGYKFKYHGLVGLFKNIADDFKDLMLGPDYARADYDEFEKDTHDSRKKFDLMATEMKKAFPDMVIGAGVGILGSLFLPGGPILGALIGSFGGFLSASEKFKEYLFGEVSKDEDRVVFDWKTGKIDKHVKVDSRKGGLIDKTVYDGFKKYFPNIALGSGLGIIGSLFLPGGPFIGALLGGLGGMISASEQMKEALFGSELDAEGNEKSLLGPKTRKAIKDSIGPALGGAALGGAAWSLISGIGIIPGLSLLPGGPIFALLGGITGAVNADDIRKFFMGEETEEDELDKNGKPTGKKVKKRKGGLFGKAFDFMQHKVMEPLGDKINAVGKSIGTWFHDSIVEPFRRSMQPLRDHLTEAGVSISNSMKNIGQHIKDSITKIFNDPDDPESPGQKMKRFFKDKVLSPLEKALNTIFDAVGKALGAIISAPFKALELVTTGGIDNKSVDQLSAEARERRKQREKEREENLKAKMEERRKRKEQKIKERMERRQSRLGFLDRLLGRNKDKTDQNASKDKNKTSTRTSKTTKAKTPTPPPVPGTSDKKTPGVNANREKNRSDSDAADAKRKNEKAATNDERNRLKAQAEEDKAKKKSSDSGDSTTNDKSTSSIRLPGRKTNNSYLKEIAANTRKIYEEIHGQIGGVGWNTAYIRTAIDKKWGGGKKNPYLKEDEYDEHMEGSRKDVKKYRNFWGRMADRISGFFTGIKDIILDKVYSLWDLIKGIVTLPFRAIGAAATFLKDHLLDIGSFLFEGAKGVANALWTVTKTLGEGFVGAVRIVGNTLLGAAKGIGEAVGNTISTLSGVLHDGILAISGVISGVVQLAGAMIPEVGMGIYKGLKAIGKGALKAVGFVWQGIKGGVSWIADKISNFTLDPKIVLHGLKIKGMVPISVGGEGLNIPFPVSYVDPLGGCAMPPDATIPVYIAGINYQMWDRMNPNPSDTGDSGTTDNKATPAGPGNESSTEAGPTVETTEERIKRETAEKVDNIMGDVRNRINTLMNNISGRSNPSTSDTTEDTKSEEKKAEEISTDESTTKRPNVRRVPRLRSITDTSESSKDETKKETKEASTSEDETKTAETPRARLKRLRIRLMPITSDEESSNDETTETNTPETAEASVLETAQKKLNYRMLNAGGNKKLKITNRTNISPEARQEVKSITEEEVLQKIYSGEINGLDMSNEARFILAGSSTGTLATVGGKIVASTEAESAKEAAERAAMDKITRKTGLEKFKQRYRKVDAAAEKSDNPREVYDNAIQNAQSMDEINAIQSAEAMNDSEAAAEGAKEEKEEKKSLLETIGSLIGGPIGGLLTKLGGSAVGKAVGGVLTKTVLPTVGTLAGVAGTAYNLFGEEGNRLWGAEQLAHGITGIGKNIGQIGKAAAGSADDMAKLGPVKSAIAKAVKAITSNKTIVKMFGSLKGKLGELASKLTSKLCGPVLEKAMQSGAKESLKSAGKQIAAFASGGGLAVAFAVADFIAGFGNAKKYFNVFGSDVSLAMRLTSGIVNTLGGLLSLIPGVGPVLSVAAAMFQDDIVQMVYSLLASDADKKELAEDQQKLQAATDAYNKANGTDLTVDEYAKQFNEKGEKETFGTRVKNVFGGLGEKAKNLATNVVTGVKNGAKAVGNAAINFVEGAPVVVDKFTSFIGNMAESIGQKLSDFADRLPELIPKVIGGFYDKLASIAENLPATIGTAIGNFFGGTIKEGGGLGEFAAKLGGGIISGGVKIAGSIVKLLFSLGKGIVTAAWAGIKIIFNPKNVINLFTSIGSGIMKTFGAMIGGADKGLSEIVRGITSAIKQALSGIVQAIDKAIEGIPILGDIYKGGKNLAKGAVEAVSSAGSAVDKGIESIPFIGGAYRGLKQAGGAVVDTVGSAVGAAEKAYSSIPIISAGYRGIKAGLVVDTEKATNGKAFGASASEGEIRYEPPESHDVTTSSETEYGTGPAPETTDNMIPKTKTSKEALEALLTLGKGLGASVMDTMADVLKGKKKIPELFGRIGEGMGNTFLGDMKEVNGKKATIFDSFATGMTNALMGNTSSTGAVTSTAQKTGVAGFIDGAKNAVSTVGNWIGNGVRAVGKGITTVVDTVGGWMPWNWGKGPEDTTPRFDASDLNGSAKIREKAAKLMDSSWGTGPVTPMSQQSSKWNHGSAEMAKVGCGPTAAAMVASAYGDKKASPVEADKLSKLTGMRAKDGGTNPAFYSKYASAHGFNMKQGPVDPGTLGTSLASGKPAVVMGKGGVYGKNTHYMVAEKASGNKVGLVDPLTGGRKSTTMSKLVDNTSKAVYSYGKGPEDKDDKDKKNSLMLETVTDLGMLDAGETDRTENEGPLEGGKGPKCEAGLCMPDTMPPDLNKSKWGTGEVLVDTGTNTSSGITSKTSTRSNGLARRPQTYAAKKNASSNKVSDSTKAKLNAPASLSTTSSISTKSAFDDVSPVTFGLSVAGNITQGLETDAATRLVGANIINGGLMGMLPDHHQVRRMMSSSNKVSQLFGKILNTFFTGSSPVARFIRSVNYNLITKIIKPIQKYVTEHVIDKVLATSTGAAAANALKTVSSVIPLTELAFAIAAFFDGINNTDQYFGIYSKDATLAMKLTSGICSALGQLLGLIKGPLGLLLSSAAALIMDDIVVFVYGLFGDKDALADAQTKVYNDLVQYNKENSPDLTMDDYLEKYESKGVEKTTMLQKVGNAFSTGVNTVKNALGFGKGPGFDEPPEPEDFGKGEIDQGQELGTVKAAAGTPVSGFDAQSGIVHKNNFPFYMQTDPRWAKVKYTVLGPNDPDYKKQNMYNSACGPTSLSMILRSYGANVDPVGVANWSRENGARTEHSGTAGGILFPKLSKLYGIDAEQLSTGSKNAITSSLSAGYPMIASEQHNDFTSGSGHFITLVGMTSDGQVLVNDPFSEKRTMKTWPVSSITKGNKSLWVFRGPNGGSINNLYTKNPASNMSLIGYTGGEAAGYADGNAATASTSGSSSSTTSTGGSTGFETTDTTGSIGFDGTLGSLLGIVNNMFSTVTGKISNLLSILTGGGPTASTNGTSVSGTSYDTSGTTGGTTSTSIGSGKNIETSTDPTVNKKRTWDWLTTEFGLTPVGASGIMGCWQAESGNTPDRIEGDYLFDFDKHGLTYEKLYSDRATMDHYTRDMLFPVYDKNGLKYARNGYILDGHYWPGIGLAQWTKGRAKNLFDWSAQNGMNWYELGTQLEYFKHENAESYTNLKDALNAAPDPTEAARQGLDIYEYPGFSKKGTNGYNAWQKRAKYAQEIYNTYINTAPEPFTDGTTTTQAPTDNSASGVLAQQTSPISESSTTADVAKTLTTSAKPVNASVGMANDMNRVQELAGKGPGLDPDIEKDFKTGYAEGVAADPSDYGKGPVTNTSYNVTALNRKVIALNNQMDKIRSEAKSDTTVSQVTNAITSAINGTNTAGSTNVETDKILNGIAAMMGQMVELLSAIKTNTEQPKEGPSDGQSRRTKRNNYHVPVGEPIYSNGDREVDDVGADIINRMTGL